MLNNIYFNNFKIIVAIYYLKNYIKLYIKYNFYNNKLNI